MIALFGVLIVVPNVILFIAFSSVTIMNGFQAYVCALNILMIEVGVTMVFRLLELVWESPSLPDDTRKVLEIMEPEDPANQLVQTPSISDLAYTMTLKESELAELYPGIEVPSDSIWRSQTFFTALFTCLLQWTFCVLLLTEQWRLFQKK
jgi:hypothetical protein